MATNFNFRVKNKRNQTTQLHSLPWSSQMDLEYRYSDFKSFNMDDMAKSCKNLVNFGPVTPVFNWGKDVHPRLRPLGGAIAKLCRDQY